MTFKHTTKPETTKGNPPDFQLWLVIDQGEKKVPLDQAHRALGNQGWRRPHRSAAATHERAARLPAGDHAAQSGRYIGRRGCSMSRRPKNKNSLSARSNAGTLTSCQPGSRLNSWRPDGRNGAL